MFTPIRVAAIVASLSLVGLVGELIRRRRIK